MHIIVQKYSKQHTAFQKQTASFFRCFLNVVCCFGHFCDDKKILANAADISHICMFHASTAGFDTLQDCGWISTCGMNVLQWNYSI